MTTMLILGIYLVGYVLAYLLFKYTWDQDGNAWQFVKPKRYLVKDRISHLVRSIFSWGAILLWLIACIVDLMESSAYDNMNKPAKW